MTVILVFGYFLFCIALAFFLDYRTKRKNAHETAEEYTTGKKSMNLFMAFALMAGNVISGSYIVGNSASVIQYDIGYLWTFYAYIIGWAITCAYIPIYRAATYKYGCATLGEVFEKFYSHRVSVCVSVMVFMAFAGAVSAQMVIVAGLLQSLLGINYGLSVALTIAAMVILALMGGMKGLARINMIHIIVLMISVVAMFIAVMTTIGWNFGQVVDELAPQGTFKLFGGSRSTVYIVGALAVQPFVTVVNALTIAGTIGSKTAKKAMLAQGMLPIFAVLFFGGVIIVACCGKFLWPDIEPSSAWYTIANYYGPVMGAVASCGVLAASMSTAPSQIMMMSSSAMEVYVSTSKRPIDEKRKMFLTKLLIIVCGVGFQLLGLISSDIVSILSNAYTVWAVCGLTFTIALLWKRPNEKAMFISILLGVITCGVWLVYGYIFGTTPFGIQITYAAAVVSIVTEVAVTLATSPRGPSESYLRYQAARQEMKAAAARGEEV